MSKVINYIEEAFFRNNILDFSKYPDDSVSAHFDKTSNEHIYIINLNSIKGTSLEQQIKKYLRYVVQKGYIHDKSGRRAWFNQVNDCLNYLIYRNVVDILDVDERFLNEYALVLDLDNRSKSSFEYVQYLTMTRIIRITLAAMSTEEQLRRNRILVQRDIYTKRVWGRGDIVFLDDLLPEISKQIKCLVIDLEKQSNMEQRRGVLYNYLPALKTLTDYLISKGVQSIYDFDLSDYKRYLDARGIIHTRNGKVNRYITVVTKLRIATDKSLNESFFDRDYWDLSELELEETRYNNFATRPMLYFDDIEDDVNKYTIKKYIKHLLIYTSNTCSTIVRKLSCLKKVCINNNAPIINIGREEIWDYLNKMNDSERVKTISILREFYDTMLRKHIISSSPIFETDIIQLEHVHRMRSVPEYITNQVFEKLDTLEEEVALIYLIIYCTGLRVSEAVSVKYDCLSKRDNVCYIKSSSYKMKKEQSNVIPQSLYERLGTYIESNRDDTFSEFVFKTKVKDWRKQDMCLSVAYFRSKLREFVEQNNIVDENGDIYNIDVHGYRHSIATTLSDMGVSLYVIQKTLHHRSVEMTMAYIDIDKKRIQKEYSNLISINGKKLTFNYESEKTIIDYLKKGLNVQALPNGICTLPTKLKRCPHANACLTCDCFATSKDYIDVLKKQRDETEAILKVSRENNWEMQIATNEEVLGNLDKILRRLESE